MPLFRGRSDPLVPSRRVTRPLTKILVLWHELWANGGAPIRLVLDVSPKPRPEQERRK